mgnify:CR=1 FL=1
MMRREEELWVITVQTRQLSLTIIEGTIELGNIETLLSLIGTSNSLFRVVVKADAGESQHIFHDLQPSDRCVGKDTS